LVVQACVLAKQIDLDGIACNLHITLKNIQVLVEDIYPSNPTYQE
jgi:hypothetical protein